MAGERLLVDWNGDGDWSDTYENLTAQGWVRSIRTQTGRDRGSTLTSKAVAGRLSASLYNIAGQFSPFNVESVLTSRPTLVAAGTASATDGATAPAPALPAGIQAGDYLVCVFYTREVTDGTVAASSGWTEIVNERSTGGLLAAWGRFYGSGVTAPTLTLTGIAANDTAIAQLAAFRDVSLIAPIGNVGTVDDNASAQNIGAISGLTLPQKGMLVVVGGKADDWTSVAALSQSGMTFAEIAETASALGTDAGLVWDTGVEDNSAEITVSSKTFSVTGGASAVGKGFMFTLNPGSRLLPGRLVKLMDEGGTIPLWIGRLASVRPMIDFQDEPMAELEAVGIFAELANQEIDPGLLVDGTGGATGDLIATFLDSAGVDHTVESGDVITGPYVVDEADALSVCRVFEEMELGFLHESIANYEVLFHDRSHREAVTSPEATLSDVAADSSAERFIEIEEDDWIGLIYNRCIARKTPYTLEAEESVITTLPGPYLLSSGETQDLIAIGPADSWIRHTRDVSQVQVAPTIASVSTVSFPTATTTHNIPMPATVNAGDLLIIVGSFPNSASSISPGTWFSNSSPSPGSGTRLRIIRKVAQGTEDGININYLTATACKGAAIVIRITGWQGTLAGGFQLSTLVEGTSVNPDPPSLNPTWGAQPTQFIACYAAQDDENPSGYPTGYGSNQTYAESDAAADSVSVAIATRSDSETAEDPPAFTIPNSKYWAAGTIAIGPVTGSVTEVGDETPSGESGAFTIGYDSGVAGTEQSHANIQIYGFEVAEGAEEFAQADYTPTQNPLTGIGIRTYRLAGAFFRTLSEAQEYADLVVERYGRARPHVTISISGHDAAHLTEVLERQVGDRITLTADGPSEIGKLGIDEDFFIESVGRIIEIDQPHIAIWTLSPASITDA